METVPIERRKKKQHRNGKGTGKSQLEAKRFHERPRETSSGMKVDFQTSPEVGKGEKERRNGLSFGSAKGKKTDPFSARFPR